MMAACCRIYFGTDNFTKVKQRRSQLSLTGDCTSKPENEPAIVLQPPREMAFGKLSYLAGAAWFWVAVFFVLAIRTLARVLRARCESDSRLPFSRQQDFPGKAPQVGHSTSCALSFIATGYASAVKQPPIDRLSIPYFTAKKALISGWESSHNTACPGIPSRS